MEVRRMAELTHTDPRLIEALAVTIGAVFGRDRILTDCLNTGGGCMVARVDLSLDGRGMGRQVWLTREDEWLLGFYDFEADEETEGVCVELCLHGERKDDPTAVAEQVAAILRALRVYDLDTPIPAWQS